MKSYAKTGVQLLMMLEVVLVGVMMLAMPTAGRPNGAPINACTTLKPAHRTTISNDSLPYKIEVSSTTYMANEDITVTVSGGDFAGVLIQVRGLGTNAIYGTWKNPPINTKIVNCSSADNSVTHSNTNTKRDSVFTWTAPSGINQDLEVVATVAEGFSNWKMGIKSKTLRSSAGLPSFNIWALGLALIAVGINI